MLPIGGNARYLKKKKKSPPLAKGLFSFKVTEPLSLWGKKPFYKITRKETPRPPHLMEAPFQHRWKGVFPLRDHEGMGAPGKETLGGKTFLGIF